MRQSHDMISLPVDPSEMSKAHKKLPILRFRRRLPTTLYAVAIVMSLGSGCKDRATDAELVAAAKVSIEKRDSASAIVRLKTVLQHNPQLGEARFLLGKALLGVGDAASALVELQKALDLHHDANLVVPELARAMLQAGQVKEVIQRYKSLQLTDQTARVDVATTLAAAYAGRSELELSLEAVNQALGADPRFRPALLLKARLAGLHRDYAQAQGLVDQVLQGDPANAEAWTLKGTLVLFSTGDEGAAMVHFRKAIESDPKYLPAQANVMSYLLLRRDLPGFEAQLTKLRQVLPNHPQTRLYGAQLLYLKGDVPQAREAVQQLLRVDPKNASTLQLAGAIELQDRKLLPAEGYLTKALQIAPNTPVAQRLLAETHIRAGRADKALATLAPLLSDPGPDSSTLALAGEAHLLNGAVKLADEFFARAAQLNPTDLGIRTRVALGRLAKGEDDGAIAELASIASQDPSGAADQRFISVLLGRQRLEPALVAIAALEKKLPTNPLGATIRGRVALQVKNYLGARAGFERALTLSAQYFPAVEGLARVDVAEGKPQEAQKRYEAFLKSQPRNDQALLALAEIKEKAGAPRQAVVDLINQAVSANPASAQPRVLLINYFLGRREYTKALDEVQSALSSLPEDPRLLVLLGQTRFRMGDTAQALGAYQRLVAAHPRADESYLRLADAQLAAKRAREAEQTLLNLLEMNNRSLDGQTALIAIRSAQGRFDEALRVAKSVQTQRPEQGVGWLVEGDLQMIRKDRPAAIKAYRESLKRSRTAPVAIKLHAALAASGQASEAETFAQKWQVEFPRDAVFRFYLAEIAMNATNYAVAERRFRDVLAITPDDARALNNLACMLLKQAKPGALQAAESANRIQPESPAIIDTLAMALADDRQFSRALKLQRKLVEDLPRAPSLRLNLARIYFQSGDKTAARKELELLKALGSKFDEQPEVTRLLSLL
jgi:putative PEP-CTERM system TPR-repeat lipoprotein